MNQNTKTALFAAAAVVVLLVAWLVRPGTPAVDANYDINKAFFPDFSDPLAAVTLEVVKFDEALAAKSEFKVAQKDGLWVIPSHASYPADAESQMKSAASLLIGLQKLGVVTGDKAEHETYGVKDPGEVTVGTKGVGTLVRLSDKDGRVLANLIIGNRVKDQFDQHYVRVPGSDRVYVSKVSADSLSTNFTDWIERDLLAVNAGDIKRISIDNYSIDETRRTKVQGDQLVLNIETGAEQPWKLKDLKEEEEVNKTKLDALKSAIDDLKIVDVERKPELLAKNLRTGREFFKDLDNPANQPIFQSLANKGYFPVPIEVLGKEDITILSNEGEVVVGLNDGIEYVLRFGEITGEDAATTETKKDEKKDDKKAAPEPKKKGDNRYMYVVARMNEALVARPVMTPLPPAPAAKPAEPGTKPAEPKEPEKKPEPEKKVEPEKKEGCEDKKEVEPKVEEKKAEEKKADEKKTAEKKEPATEVKPAAPAPTVATPPAADPAIAAHEAEVKRVTEENQQKQKDYEAALDKARKRVTELNARFADWYYVIPDSEFVKIRLARKDVVGPNKALLNKKAGEAFLAENKTKEGIITTASGLQYKVLEEGTGKSPKATDEVAVAYKGTLIDGTVFDESKPGMPAQFAVEGVIKGWTEALQLMKEGGKLQLFIPSDLAYGPKGSGDKIGPNSVLIFEVELLTVK